LSHFVNNADSPGLKFSLQAFFDFKITFENSQSEGDNRVRFSVFYQQTMWTTCLSKPPEIFRFAFFRRKFLITPHLLCTVIRL